MSATNLITWPPKLAWVEEGGFIDGLALLLIVFGGVVIAVGWQYLKDYFLKVGPHGYDIDELHAKSGCPTLTLLLGVILGGCLDSGRLAGWICVFLFIWGMTGLDKKKG